MRSNNFLKLMIPIIVFLGGGTGSLARYLISYYIPYKNGFPWATLLTNLLACLALGYFISLFEKLTLNNITHYRFFFLTGFCGGFSTFSTFSYETISLLRIGHYWMAGLYVFLSVVMGLAFVFLGSKL